MNEKLIFRMNEYEINFQNEILNILIKYLIRPERSEGMINLERLNNIQNEKLLNRINNKIFFRMNVKEIFRRNEKLILQIQKDFKYYILYSVDLNGVMVGYIT